MKHTHCITCGKPLRAYRSRASGYCGMCADTSKPVREHRLSETLGCGEVTL